MGEPEVEEAQQTPAPQTGPMAKVELTPDDIATIEKIMRSEFEQQIRELVVRAAQCADLRRAIELQRGQDRPVLPATGSRTDSRTKAPPLRQIACCR